MRQLGFSRVGASQSNQQSDQAGRSCRGLGPLSLAPLFWTRRASQLLTLGGLCLGAVAALAPGAQAQTYNEAPVNRLGGVAIPGSGGSATTSGNGTLVFASNSATGALSISDADAGSGALTTTLYVSNGTLSAPNGGGLVSGSGSARLSLSGTLSQINAALEGLTFSGVTDGGATLFITTSDNGNTGGAAQITASTLSLSVSGTLPATSGAILSEFRFHGAGGPADEYVEIYNTLGVPLNIGGWSIKTNTGTAASPQIQTTVVPPNTRLPVRGHFLFTGGAYSLSAYGSGDASIAGDISDDSGVALYNAGITPQVQDAVGFASSLSSLREGAGLPSAPAVDGQYTFLRDFLNSGPKDSGDSSQDFVFITTNGTAMSGAAVTGTGGSLPSQLGAPGPEGLTSPVYANDQVGTLLLDTGVSSAVAPNRVRIGSGDSGTLESRRTLVNNSGRTLTRVRFIVTRITSQGSPVIFSPQADMRLVSSSDQNVLLSSGAMVPVYGTTVEAPTSDPVGSGQTTLGGGGLLSSLSFTSVLSTPLPDGESRNYSWKMNVARSGSFLITFNVLALPDQTWRPRMAPTFWWDRDRLCHVFGHRQCTVAFAGMVAAGEKRHAGLAGVVRLRLRDFTSDERISPGRNRRFEIPLRTAGAPGDAPQRPAVTGHHRGCTLQSKLQQRAQLRRRHRLRRGADEAQVLLTEPRLRHPLKARAELRVVAQLGVRVQRQVVGEQADLVRQQQLQALLEPARDAPVLALPEQAVVHQDRIGARVNGRFDQRTACGYARDDFAHLGLAFNLQTVRPIITKAGHVEQGIEAGLDLTACCHSKFLMRKTWLIFSQAVTVAVAVLFVVATLKPDWMARRAEPAVPAVASVVAPPALQNVALGTGAGVTSYSGAAKRATPAVVSITASKAPAGNPHNNDPWFQFFFGERSRQGRRSRRWAWARASLSRPTAT